jgi:hypothetical protein
MKIKPEIELTLPDRGSIKNAEIGQEYSRFIDQLQVAADGNVIISDPYFFSVDIDGISESVGRWLEALTQAERNKLLLLSLFSRSFDSSCLWPEGRPKFVDDPVVQLFFSHPDLPSLAEGASEPPLGLDSLPNRRKVLNDPGLKSLLDLVPVRSPIETISSEFVGNQPGNYAYQMWQVSDWNEDWAVVFGVDDAGYANGYPFPWLLGFCRRQDLERNFVTLLNEGSEKFDAGFYSTYGKIESKWKLAILALTAHADYAGPQWDLVEKLLTLDGNVLETFYQDCEDSHLGLLDRLREILNSADEAGLGELSFAELIDKAGGKPSLLSIEEKLPGWQEEFDNS